MNVGLLGLGFMGSTHWNAWAGLPDWHVAAVMDQDETRLSGDLSAVAGNLGEPGRKLDFSALRRYRRPEEILADPDLDAVDICLPTALHEPLTVEALRKGKHVLVEKPMALEGEAADRMAAAAESSGRILMVAQVLRFMAPYRALGELVRSGRLGRVRAALFRRRTAAPAWAPWEFDASLSGGGVFDLLIHDVDIALLLFGMPEAISAAGHEDLAGGADMLAAELYYPDIGSVTITGGWHLRGDYPFSMEYTVVGDRGVAEYHSSERPAAVYWNGGGKELLPDDGADPYRAEVEYFAQCCRRGQPPGLCPPRESATAVRLARLICDARKRRREWIRIEGSLT